MEFRHSIIWGLYLGITLSMMTQILTWLGLGTSNWFIYLTYILVIIFISIGLKKLKSKKEGKLSFISSFSFVLVTILLSRLLFQTYMFVYTHYIDPNWVSKVANIWTQQMEQAGISAEQISNSIQGFKEAYQTGNMFTIELIKYGVPQIIIGVLISLYFVFKKTK